MVGRAAQKTGAALISKQFNELCKKHEMLNVRRLGQKDYWLVESGNVLSVISSFWKNIVCLRCDCKRPGKVASQSRYNGYNSDKAASVDRKLGENKNTWFDASKNRLDEHLRKINDKLNKKHILARIRGTKKNSNDKQTRYTVQEWVEDPKGEDA